MSTLSTKLKIVKFGDPILRKVVEPVAQVTPELVRLTDDMLETMHQASGVGLAANQVGLDMAIAVIGYRETVMRMFNPRIVDRSGEALLYGEGCLSVPGVDEVDHLNGIVIVNHFSMAARTLHRKTLDRLKSESLQKKASR
jgi:peptide deformylase